MDDEHKLTPEQREKLDEAIKLMPFAPKTGKLNKTHLVEHVLDTGDAKPVRMKQHPMSPYKQELAMKEIDRMIERDIIERVNFSSWLNPILCVPKPNGTTRVVLDARGLNNVTKKNSYVQPNLNSLLSQI